MLLIFNLSSQAAEQSNQLSTDITKVIVKTVEKVHLKVSFDIKNFNHIIRKNAHFFAYLVLGLLVMNAMKKIGPWCLSLNLLIGPWCLSLNLLTY
ncbi:VanZ family protein [Crassaminicella profunda]|uniref:VanZ family protein n=1 Tax=Crassaminicella profunda TaxID=1286698 RepID=UPI001FE9B8EE